MRKLFAGELSVAVTYWCGFVLFNVFMRLVFIGLAAVSIHLYVNWNERAVDFLFLAASALPAVYCAFLARGQYRAMYNDRTPSVWSWIGLVLIVGGVATYAYGAASTVLPGLKVSQRAFEREISAMRMTLPVEIEPGLRRVDVTYRNKVLSYVIEVDDAGILGEDFNLLQDGDGLEICRDLSGVFKGTVDRVEYEYRHGTERMVSTMDGKACLDLLAQE